MSHCMGFETMDQALPRDKQYCRLRAVIHLPIHGKDPPRTITNEQNNVERCFE